MLCDEYMENAQEQFPLLGSWEKKKKKTTVNARSIFKMGMRNFDITGYNCLIRGLFLIKT